MPAAIAIEPDVPVRMRDGVTLFADIYRPESGGLLPVLLRRTPYDRNMATSTFHPEWFARQGYIVVAQDTRGRYRSEGEWYPFLHEAEDGYDTVEWAATIPGSSGQVAMYGASYAGATQMLAATTTPPHLSAMAPAVTASDYYQGWTYEGGALSQAFVQSWTLLLMGNSAMRAGDEEALDDISQAQLTIGRTYGRLPLTDLGGVRSVAKLAPYYLDWLEHPTRDEYWRRWSIRERYARIAAPALHIGGWYDIFLEGTLENFEGLRREAATPEARAGQRLLVGPWHHAPWTSFSGGVDFGDEGANIANQAMIRWYDHVLKGLPNGAGDEPPVRLFVMGVNRWRFEDDWPLKRAVDTPYYLHSDGGATSFHGDGTLSRQPPGEEPNDVFHYTPAGPVPSAGGHSCCTEALAPMGAYDQRKVEARGDVLCYTSEPLAHDLEVSGWVSCRLWASTTGEDADWTAKLVDVLPDGRALNITDGIIRARFRESLEQPSPIRPGGVYEYTIRMRATSNVFRAGHRIRLEVSSSNFPMFDRNPGRPIPPGEVRPLDLQNAVHRVFHDGGRPSALLLPVAAGG
jgi:putative CocE/NonD family hydrolase